MIAPVDRSTTKRHDARALWRTLLVALPLSCAAAWSQSAVPTTASAAGSTATARAAARRCHSVHATIDACDDAVRWNPQDASLLIAMGDVHMRAQHLADAARAYRHAFALAPSTPGLQQKISNVDARLAKINARTKSKVTPKAVAKLSPKADAKTVPPSASTSKVQPPAAPTTNPPPLSAATAPAAVKHFSNADPEPQSHCREGPEAQRCCCVAAGQPSTVL